MSSRLKCDMSATSGRLNRNDRSHCDLSLEQIIGRSSGNIPPTDTSGLILRGAESAAMLGFSYRLVRRQRNRRRTKQGYSGFLVDLIQLRCQKFRRWRRVALVAAGLRY